MITGLGSAEDLASGKRGAFYNTLEEFHKYWDRIDIIAPKVEGEKLKVKSLFGNVYIHISPLPLILHPIWFLKKGIEIYKEQKFDLMTVHDFPPFYNGIGARLLWQKIKVPYILEILHIPGYPRPAGGKEKIYKNLMKWFVGYDASKAKAVRVMNESQVPNFLIKAGVPKNKIIHIPAVYIDLDIFRPMDMVKEYDLIFIGRLEANKGINLFLNAVKKLNCKAIVVGKGSLYNTIKSEVESRNLKVTMHGWAKDSQEIAGLINKSKILVMPSYNEGGPRVVIETLACGVPALATSVGIMPDVLKNDLGGAIIDWSGEDIASKAKNLLSDSGAYQKHRLAGLELAKKFEKKMAIKNYADKLKSLI